MVRPIDLVADVDVEGGAIMWIAAEVGLGWF